MLRRLLLISSQTVKSQVRFSEQASFVSHCNSSCREPAIKMQLIPAGELVHWVEEKSPVREVFQFPRLAQGLTQSGTYLLRYRVSPHPPGLQELCVSVHIHVVPGPPAAIDIQVSNFFVAIMRAHDAILVSVCSLFFGVGA